MNKLFVVGSGIKSVAHISEESKILIQKSDKVLYLVNEPLLKQWIEQQSICSESLDLVYNRFKKRVDAYHALTQYIIEQYDKFQSLCVVFYGHPTVFANSALSAVRQINKNGGHSVILPAISSMDCLFSDLQIDPGNSGCFSIDATELLICERQVDIYSHLILWQVASLGTHDKSKTNKISVLKDYLSGFYKGSQPICIYEAAQLPTTKPRIEWVTLEGLKDAMIKHTSTVYIPPSTKKKISEKYTALLEIDANNFVISKK